MAERRPLEPNVVGSSPTPGAMEHKINRVEIRDDDGTLLGEAFDVFLYGRIRVNKDALLTLSDEELANTLLEEFRSLKDDMSEHFLKEVVPGFATVKFQLTHG